MIRSFRYSSVLATCLFAVSLPEKGLADEDLTITVSVEEKELLAADTQRLFKTYCWRCHQGQGSSSGEDFDVLNVQGLTDDGQVVPESLDDSQIWDAISSGRMPPDGIKLRPTLLEGQTMRRWIQVGAPSFPTNTARPFVSTADVHEAAQLYLVNPRKMNPTVNADQFDPTYIRFLTLHNLHNNPRIANSELNLARAGISKVLNSMSWKNRLVLPIAVDPHQVVYAIDLRDYGWEANNEYPVNVWDDVMARRYPYGIRYTDDLIRPAQEYLEEKTNCSLPMVRADWFVSSVTRPGLYFTMMRMPKDATVLEEYLGVKIRENLLQPKSSQIARSGMMLSGVSAQNRLVERNEMKYPGAYWKSYDFKPNSPMANLSRYPLGPQNLYPKDQHPFFQQAFIHDGGEMIFHLPNGMLGYYLVDGEDKQIPAGPIDVVADDQETVGAPIIENALSCMACHAKGFRKVKDDIRVTNPFKGRYLRHIEQLYPIREVMDQLMAEDQAIYERAVAAATAPYLLPKGERLTNPRDVFKYGEPVSATARIYLNNRLGLEEIAQELNLKDVQTLSNYQGVFKTVGLAGMFKQETGMQITRQQWESGVGMSLMQEVSSEMFEDRHPKR